MYVLEATDLRTESGDSMPPMEKQATMAHLACEELQRER
jgi:hypothetical protein